MKFYILKILYPYGRVKEEREKGKEEREREKERGKERERKGERDSGRKGGEQQMHTNKKKKYGIEETHLN